MQLYAIVVNGVYPRQIITISDSETWATSKATKLKALVEDRAEFVSVETVTGFYPEGFTNADPAWLRLYDSTI